MADGWGITRRWETAVGTELPAGRGLPEQAQVPGARRRRGIPTAVPTFG